MWRCHIGRDTSNRYTDEGWAFVHPYIENADAFIFSRAEFIPPWLDRAQAEVIPPSVEAKRTRWPRMLRIVRFHW